MNSVLQLLNSCIQLNKRCNWSRSLWLLNLINIWDGMSTHTPRRRSAFRRSSSNFTLAGGRFFWWYLISSYEKWLVMSFGRFRSSLYICHSRGFPLLICGKYHLAMLHCCVITPPSCFSSISLMPHGGTSIVWLIIHCIETIEWLTACYSTSNTDTV